jgi:hypothetical protein
VLKITQSFDKLCSCRLQGEYVDWTFFLEGWVGQTAGGEFDMTDLIGGAAERIAIQLVNQSYATRHLLPVLYTVLSKNAQLTFTVKMAPVMFVETDNFKHSA